MRRGNAPSRLAGLLANSAMTALSILPSPYLLSTSVSAYLGDIEARKLYIYSQSELIKTLDYTPSHK
jgi:hypothetical protein